MRAPPVCWLQPCSSILHASWLSRHVGKCESKTTSCQQSGLGHLCFLPQGDAMITPILILGKGVFPPFVRCWPIFAEVPSLCVFWQHRSRCVLMVFLPLQTYSYSIISLYSCLYGVIPVSASPTPIHSCMRIILFWMLMCSKQNSSLFPFSYWLKCYYPPVFKTLNSWLIASPFFQPLQSRPKLLLFLQFISHCLS